MDDRAALENLFEALERSIDAERLGQELTRRFGARPTAEDAPPPRREDAPPPRREDAPPPRREDAPLPHTPDPGPARDDVLGKLVLADLLDEAILGARPGDKEFPLRLLLVRLGEMLDDEAALSFACGLGLYFRAPMDEETRMRVGVEVSRLFYAFAEKAGLDRESLHKTAPLLATLLTGELQRLRFESVDHAAIFDSALHEREAGSDGQSSRLVGARTFLCRVSSSDKVRAKAVVRT